MKRLQLGLGALAVVALGVVLIPPLGSGAQTTLQAKISPQQVTPTGTPLLESIDVCSRGASAPQINTVVTGPDGAVVIDQWHLVGTTEPGVVVNSDGSWSVELRLRDDAGQPTGEPFPALGTYTVDVDCVTTYTPQVRIPYNDLSFEVVDSTTTSTTATTSTTVTPPASTATPPDGSPSSQPPPAGPLPGNPNFTG